MVGTVYAHFDWKILEKTGVFYHNGSMERIAGRAAVQMISFHVLKDCAAEGNIDELHSFTDADDRDSGGNGCVECLKLQNIKFRINRVGAF